MTKEDIKKLHTMDRQLGIINEVIPGNSYSAPAVLSNDGVYMNGRTFRVVDTNSAELVDYKRNGANALTTLKADETDYVLDQEKFWGMQIDDLDIEDLNEEVENYQIAKQTQQVVAPYLDKLRFSTLIKNHNKHVSFDINSDKPYSKILEITTELDELNVQGNRILFVTPKLYAKIKDQIVAFPQGDTSQQVLYKGAVGEFDGFTVIKVPSKYLDETGNVQAIATVDNVLVSPVQISKFEKGRLGAGSFGVYLQQLLYLGAFVLQKNQSKIVVLANTQPTQDKDGTAVAPKN